MSMDAVFDCMVYLQAVANPAGPAMACFNRLDEPTASNQPAAKLFISHGVFVEIVQVLLRPELRRKLRRLTPEIVAEFLDQIRNRATWIDPVPSAFRLPRDPTDEPYLNLAIASGADYLVTWNARHLTYLMSGNTAEGLEFLKRYAKLRIVDPVDFLKATASP